VSEKYRLVESVMASDTQYTKFMPTSWTSMVQIKTNHYRALSHYFVALSLLHKDFSQVRDPLNIYNGFYASDFPADYPKIEDMTKRKNLRKELAYAHLQLALQLHEISAQIQRCCTTLKNVGTLVGQFLRHSLQVKQSSDEN
jgi:hypothetical protein